MNSSHAPPPMESCTDAKPLQFTALQFTDTPVQETSGTVTVLQNSLLVPVVSGEAHSDFTRDEEECTSEDLCEIYSGVYALHFSDQVAA